MVKIFLLVSNRLCLQVILLIKAVLELEVPDFLLVAISACRSIMTYLCLWIWLKDIT